MPKTPRAELEEMVSRFVAANDEAGRTGNWSPLGDFYTEDAIYSWNTTPKHEFVARGRDEIRRFVFGTEMDGLDQWTYPYVKVLIDDEKGEVIGIWRQLAPIEQDDGSPYEIAGTGGSWFKYGGNYQWKWQRDFFDHGNAGALFMQLMQADKLSEGMQQRMKAGSRAPGWVRRSEFDWYDTIPADGD